jgi:DedD protein
VPASDARTASVSKTATKPVPPDATAPTKAAEGEAKAATKAAATETKSEPKSVATNMKGQPGPASETRAATPTSVAEATPEPKAEPKAAPAAVASSAPPAAASAKADGFVVQLAAFADDKGANALANKLKKAGYQAYTEPLATSKGTLWRVRVGPYPSREAAAAGRDKLKGEGYSGIVAAAK